MHIITVIVTLYFTCELDLNFLSGSCNSLELKNRRNFSGNPKDKTYTKFFTLSLKLINIQCWLHSVDSCICDFSSYKKIYPRTCHSSVLKTKSRTKSRSFIHPTGTGRVPMKGKELETDPWIGTVLSHRFGSIWRIF